MTKGLTFLEENLKIADEIERAIRKDLLGEHTDKKNAEKDAIAASKDVVLLADAKSKNVS